MVAAAAMVATRRSAVVATTTAVRARNSSASGAVRVLLGGGQGRARLLGVGDVHNGDSGAAGARDSTSLGVGVGADMAGMGSVSSSGLVLRVCRRRVKGVVRRVVRELAVRAGALGRLLRLLLGGLGGLSPGADPARNVDGGVELGLNGFNGLGGPNGLAGKDGVGHRGGGEGECSGTHLVHLQVCWRKSRDKCWFRKPAKEEY